jgi:hypothetical protein
MVDVRSTWNFVRKTRREETSLTFENYLSVRWIMCNVMTSIPSHVPTEGHEAGSRRLSRVPDTHTSPGLAWLPCYTHPSTSSRPTQDLRIYIAIPVTGHGGRLGCEMLRISHCLNSRLTVNCEILATCSSTYSPVRTSQEAHFVSIK